MCSAKHINANPHIVMATAPRGSSSLATTRFVSALAGAVHTSIKTASFVYYADVVTVNVVTANAMLFRLCNLERCIHTGPKRIQFRSQMDPRIFQKALRKALLL